MLRRKNDNVLVGLKKKKNVTFKQNPIDDLYAHMKELRPFSAIEMDVLYGHFFDYMVFGGMPEVVNTFVKQGNFSGTLEKQRQLLLDYEEDITKYATASLNKLTENKKYSDIQFGIKLCHKNIGFNGKYYTFPYFLTFLLPRFLAG